jgi:hypothetical protein
MAWRLNAGNETEVMDARGRNVARAHCGGTYGVNLDEAEAHARLIAAAPDMLAALEAVLPDLWDGIEFATDQNANESWLADALHRLDVARAAVNKAKEAVR